MRTNNFYLIATLTVIALLAVIWPGQMTWAMPSHAPNLQTVPPRPPKPGGGGGTEDSGLNGSPSLTPPPAGYSVVVDRRVDLQGSKIDIPLPGGHCLIVQVQPGALQREIALQVTTVDPALAPADTCNSCPEKATKRLCTAGVAYVLKGWYADTGQEVGAETLSGTYSHVICYTDADVALADNDPDNLVIATYDQAKGAWVDLPSKVDKINKNVGALADHLGYFALMASKACTTTTALQ